MSVRFHLVVRGGIKEGEMEAGKGERITADRVRN